MWPVTSWAQSLLAVGVLFVLAMTSARLLQPAFWRSRAVRTATLASFGGMLAGIALWVVGDRRADHSLVYMGAGLAYTGMLIFAPAILVLPISALLDRVLMRLLDRREPATEPPTELPAELVPAPGPRVRLSRRGMIRAGTASLPALAAATGVKGLVDARRAPRITVVPMRYEGLHPDLDGLRILQLSDLHLGVYAGLGDLAAALEQVMAEQRPDVIVLTGDLADDPQLIAGALELVAAAGARHGAVASLGNHEYLHDIDVTRPLYEASRVPLLVSAGRTLTIGRARLFIAGADDPMHIEGNIEGMVKPSVERAVRDCPEGADFRLLLCHRPEGFGPAAEAGFDLTLAGHTHGGQIGVFGRSILETLMPGTGWWGTYSRARTDGQPPARLYTTSGFGHWFPFRVGCPTEMPVIVLERTTERRTPAERVTRRV